METVYLLSTAQASAALSVEWEQVRFVAFKLSPSHLRTPGKWLTGSWVDPHPHCTRTRLLFSY